MKRRKLKKYVSFFLICVLAACSYSMNAEAGSSNIVVDNSSFEKELDTSLWNNVDGDVQLKDGMLVFPKESTETTSLITKTTARRTGYHENLVSADITMRMIELPEGEAFVLAFGLGSIEALMGEPGNVEISFTGKNGVTASVTAYDDAGNAVTVADEAVCGTIGSKMKINV